MFSCLVALWSSIQGGKEFIVVVMNSAFFYCTPFIVWTLIQTVLKPRESVIHTGYIAITLALLIVASIWLLPPDSSGLPIQWMLYWPLSGILVVVSSGVTYFISKREAPNKAM